MTGDEAPRRATDGTRARLSVLGAAVLWSTAGAAIKSARGLDAWEIAGGRALVAGLVFLAFVPAARRGWSRATAGLAVAYAATTVLFVFANTLTTAANAIFLQDVAPLWVLLLSPWLLGERPTRSELLAAPVYLGGTALFFLDALGPGQALGNGIAILSGVAFALLILGLRARRDEGAEAGILAGSLLAAAVCAAGAAFGSRAETVARPPVGARDVLIITYLGTFQLGAAYLLFARGLRALSALEASLLALVEPVLSPVWALALAGERPGRWAVAGGAVILGATVARLALGARRAGK